MFLSNHSLRSESSLIDALHLSGYTQTFCLLCTTKQSPGQNHTNYSFKSLSDVFIKSKKLIKIHVILCHSSSLIRWNGVNHHTLIHPYHVSLFSNLVMPWTVVYAFINLFFYQSLMLTVISEASHVNPQEWWQMQVLFLSGKKRLCHLHKSWSNHSCSLSPTELTMETKMLFGSGWEEIYVRVWICMSHYYCFTIS